MCPTPNGCGARHFEPAPVVPAARAAYDRPMRRLDEDKLEQLRHWGAGLAATADEELRATGKAILLLIEEIEALHVELWNEKTAAAPVDDGEPEPEAVAEPPASLDGTLGARLRRLGRRSARETA